MKKSLPIKREFRQAKKHLKLSKVNVNNLKNVSVNIPSGVLTVVTGVAGSGKSSLINEAFMSQYPDAILIDQSAVGISSRSNPATYTGVFDLIRELFALLPESKVRGYHPRRFSFNQKGGRCEACEGMGQKKIEMHFLPDVWVECAPCSGSRYTPESRDVRYHGKSIADVLTMRVSEALELLGNIQK